jgi:hypothetical protein
MEKESSGYRPVEANSTGGQGSRRAVAPSDDDDDDDDDEMGHKLFLAFPWYTVTYITNSVRSYLT